MGKPLLIMKASELLDEVVKALTALGDKPLISESLAAFKKAESLIKEEMEAQYNDGYEHRKKCEANAKLNQQKNQN